MTTRPTNELHTPSDIHIPVNGRQLHGELEVPAGALAIVVFAHGSGSCRCNPQNCLVAQKLKKAGVATLLIDLLDEEETHDRHNVFDVELQASRLVEVAHWLSKNSATRFQCIGYFGTGIGAGAALLAAAKEPSKISAVVSSGGRPDTVMFWLGKVKAPTLLIVGECDVSVLNWNEDAYRRLATKKALVTVPHATHFSEEPAALEVAARHACRWFVRYLSPSAIHQETAALTG